MGDVLCRPWILKYLGRLQYSHNLCQRPVPRTSCLSHSWGVLGWLSSEARLGVFLPPGHHLHHVIQMFQQVCSCSLSYFKSSEEFLQRATREVFFDMVFTVNINCGGPAWYDHAPCGKDMFHGVLRQGFEVSERNCRRHRLISRKCSCAGHP